MCSQVFFCELSWTSLNDATKDSQSFNSSTPPTPTKKEKKRETESFQQLLFIY